MSRLPSRRLVATTRAPAAKLVERIAPSPANLSSKRPLNLVGGADWRKFRAV